MKRSDSAGETLHLPGDQRGDGEGISKRGRDIDIVDIKEEDRTGPSDDPTDVRPR